MTQTNKQLTFNQICQTYGLNKIGEDNQQIFLSCLKPVKSIESLIKKLTGKTVTWQSIQADNYPNNKLVEESDHLPINKKILEKILTSFLSTSHSLNAQKFRLEPSVSEYRWRVYDLWGWHTIQTLPHETGKQLCHEILQLAGITNSHLPQVAKFTFKNRHLQCHSQPIWQGIVIQLDFINSTKNACDLNTIELFKQSSPTSLFYIGERHHHHNHPLAEEFEKLTKQFDILTIGERLNDFDILLPLPNTVEEFDKIISLAPDIAVINYPDITSVMALVKKLNDHKIKTLVNVTSKTPWPILALIKNEHLNNCHLVISKTAEQVCPDCKTNIGPDKRIAGHSQNNHKGWLENEIWENGDCPTNHEQKHYHLIINDWDNDLLTVYKKLANQLDHEIIKGNVSWHTKNTLADEQAENYFNF